MRFSHTPAGSSAVDSRKQRGTERRKAGLVDRVIEEPDADSKALQAAQLVLIVLTCNLEVA